MANISKRYKSLQSLVTPGKAYSLDEALKLPKPPVCIMMTAYGSVDTAVEAMRRGKRPVPEFIDVECMQAYMQQRCAKYPASAAIDEVKMTFGL